MLKPASASGSIGAKRCETAGDLLEHLSEQDTVAFTGSATTARKLRVHPNLVARTIPFNAEADSLNASVLGLSVRPGDPEFLRGLS